MARERNMIIEDGTAKHAYYLSEEQRALLEAICTERYYKSTAKGNSITTASDRWMDLCRELKKPE